MGKQRILLVDDHEVVRIGLRALLERNTQFEVVEVKRVRQRKH